MTTFCLTSQHPLSHPPMHTTAVSGYSASPPIRRFVSSFHALAHDVCAVWSASSYLLGKFLTIYSEPAAESMRSSLEE